MPARAKPFLLCQLCLACLISSACLAKDPNWKRIATLPTPSKQAPEYKFQEHYYPATDTGPRQLRRRVSGFLHSDGRFVRHGLVETFFRDGSPARSERYHLGQRDGQWAEWYADGEKKWDRSYTLDRESGLWKSFHSNGQLQSEVSFEEQQPQTMRWWREDGSLSSEGPARRGVKQGVWTEWYESGQVRARGHYAGGQRDGAWTFFDEYGAVTYSGHYLGGARVRAGA